MNNQVVQIEQNKQSCVALKDSPEGKEALAVKVYGLFETCKLYGKSPESLEPVIKVFREQLGEYTTEQVVMAFDTHIQRSQEFPTVADIAGLIRRDGRQSISDAMYVTIAKKDWEDRTAQEQQAMSDYESERLEGWDSISPHKAETLRADNEYLRKELKSKGDEINRLNEIIRSYRAKQPFTAPAPMPQQQRIENTIKHMQESGASEEEITEFKQSCGIIDG